ncbi:hypothetical protein IEQ34_026733 [Dendrobium chrysotoxum]|uniref:Uncharacterized protein n=1 Tax=Dendrobium chrysotoxum TaxID=161865 RepID=A0AAV7FLI2_DENCH|nr:hypothetical protein IEQ34_026733 [Dendrobium chrysotoxum]
MDCAGVDQSGGGGEIMLEQIGIACLVVRRSGGIIEVGPWEIDLDANCGIVAWAFNKDYFNMSILFT